MNVTSRSLLLVLPFCVHSYRHVSTPIRSSLLSRCRTRGGVTVASRVRPVKLQASSGQSPKDNGTLLDRMETLSEKVSENFAVVAVGCLALGLTCPTPFLWFDAGMVSIALGISMLAMGCTLNLEDFVILTQRPWQLFIGIVLQYSIMPLTGFAISRIASLSNEIAAGVVLVSCCPGGVASNIVTFLAQGDVALSVAMTSISTALAIGMTPFLTTVLLGTLVPVDGWALLKSTVQVIMVPLVLGIGVKSLFPKLVKRLEKIAPLIAVIAVAMINISITAQNARSIIQSGVRIFSCVFCLHGVGFSLGYLMARFFRLPSKSCTTISIEVGMQNSGLGAVLAAKHFGDPLSSSVCVASAVLHSFLGGLIATWTRNKHNATYE